MGCKEKGLMSCRISADIFRAINTIAKQYNVTITRLITEIILESNVTAINKAADMVISNNDLMLCYFSIESHDILKHHAKLNKINMADLLDGLIKLSFNQTLNKALENIAVEKLAIEKVKHLSRQSKKSLAFESVEYINKKLG